MADVMFPGMEGLGNMEFMSPIAFQQAQQQIGLANQFAQQNLQQKQADYTASILKNLFDAQNNPLILQNNQLKNEGMGYKNAGAQIDARKRAKLELWETEAQKEDYAAKTSADKLKTRMSDLEQDLVSMDPEVRARATALYQNTAGMLKLKETNDARVAAADARANSAERIAGAKIDSAERIAGENNASRERIAQQRAAAIANKAKDNPKNAEQAAVYYQMQADTETDPQRAAQAADLAKKYGAYSMALKNAGAGTKPDMAQFGIQTNPVNIGIGSAPAAPLAPRAGVAPSGPSVPGAMPTESAMAADLAPLLAQIRNAPPAVVQKELTQAQAALAAATRPDEKAVLGQYVTQLQGELQRKQASGQAATPPAAPANNAPTAGTVYKGYRFKGGDPSKKENWIKE